MQVSKVFIVHKHKSICNINDMFSCHFLGLVELVDFEHPTCKGDIITFSQHDMKLYRTYGAFGEC